MMIRAIACDVDQTLTNRDLLLDLDAVRVVRSLYQGGVPVILVTSHDYPTAGWLSMFLGTCGVIAAENGSVIYDARAYGPVYVLGEPYRVRSALSILKESLGERVRVDTSCCRMCDTLIGANFSLEEGNAILRERGLQARLVESGLGYHLCDIDTNRGKGMQAAAARLGLLPEEVAVIASHANELDMFPLAGRTIALANAPYAMRRQADCSSHGEYGQGFIEAVQHLQSLTLLPLELKLPQLVHRLK
jgi:phosphoglycolate phosphatase